MFVEEFSFCEIGYEFKNFDGIKEIKSNKYDFKVTFCNSKDFRYKGNIEYKIYIPYLFLKNKLCLNSKKECEDLFLGNIVETINGVDVDTFSDFLCEIKCNIEEEIFKFLEENNLVNKIEIDY